MCLLFFLNFTVIRKLRQGLFSSREGFQCRPTTKKEPYGSQFIRVGKELTVAAVNGLALVFLAAGSCLLHEVLAFLRKSVAEIAAAAETHLCERFLDVRLDDHKKEGNEVSGQILMPRFKAHKCVLRYFHLSAIHIVRCARLSVVA